MYQAQTVSIFQRQFTIFYLTLVKDAAKHIDNELGGFSVKTSENGSVRLLSYCKFEHTSAKLWGKNKSLKAVLSTILLVTQLLSPIKLIKSLFCMIKYNRCGSKSRRRNQTLCQDINVVNILVRRLNER